MSAVEAPPAPVLAGPVPPAKPPSLLKVIREADRNVVSLIPIEAYEKPIMRLSIGPRQILLVSDPAGVKRVLLDNVSNYPKSPIGIHVLGAAFGDGLLTSDGEKWRSHRRIMSPAFDHKSIVSYTPAMTETIGHWMEKWRSLERPIKVDIADEMTSLTLQLISRTMFSSDSDGICALMGDTLRRGTDAMQFRLRQALPLIGPWARRRRIASIRRIFGGLDRSIYRLIEARGKLKGEAPRDLLDRLVAARDGETGAKLTDEEVRDEVVIIFMAGHETTAVAMTFVWYLISQHPEVEARLHREIDTVLGSRVPMHEDLERLPYVRMVIEEAMRLYPPAPALSSRQCQTEDMICGRRIESREPVAVLPWVLHRHRALWDDPERFDPERFTPEKSAQRPRFAYMPFGGGPRICIGASLAMTEASLILAMMAQRYRLRLAPRHKVSLQFRVTLRPRGGMKMILELR